MVNGARDFRLMRRNMVDAVLQLSEYNRFSKGSSAGLGLTLNTSPMRIEKE